MEFVSFDSCSLGYKMFESFNKFLIQHNHASSIFGVFSKLRVVIDQEPIQGLLPFLQRPLSSLECAFVDDLRMLWHFR